MKRTTQQNKALHKWFEMVAQSLNDEGLTVADVLAHSVELEWTSVSVKELIWNPVHQALMRIMEEKPTDEEVFNALKLTMNISFNLQVRDFISKQKFIEYAADSLNHDGFTIQKVLEKARDRVWSKDSVKELLWRPIQRDMQGIESTADVETGDYNKVYEVLNRHLSTHFGVHVPFPSEKELSEAQR